MLLPLLNPAPVFYLIGESNSHCIAIQFFELPVLGQLDWSLLEADSKC